MTECRLKGRARHVTFVSGAAVIEHLVDWDDEAMQVAYAVESPGIAWHLATAQVQPAEGGSQFLWTTRLAPAELADWLGTQMDLGVAAMTATLEQAAAAELPR